MKKNVELLNEALIKQHELIKSDYWSSELLAHSPPVLWFGDSNREKKVITVGANPSRREFLDGRNGHYLMTSKRRFHHLKTPDIIKTLKDEEALGNIIQSYESYYHINPYRTWFGKPRGSKVEGFLNGLGASLYGLEPIGAVHADLIPFPTMSDFSKLNDRMLKRDFFHSGWAKSFFNKLMELLNPSAIIVFGRTNVEYFSKHYGNLTLNRSYNAYGKLRARYGLSKYQLLDHSVPFVGLSVNLGNPIGFTREMLNEFGAFIRSNIRMRVSNAYTVK